MNVTAGLLDFFILVVVALVPTVLYLEMVRGSERYRTEAWGSILGAFAYGAFFATLVAGILEAVLVGVGTSFAQAYPAPEFSFLNGNSSAGLFFLVLVIAPFVEEALKASGVVAYRKRIQTVADGPVLGASVGLGFGFLETLLYGLGAFLVGGLAAGILLILIRSISSVLLHASSTAVFGYGYAESRVGVPRRSVTGRYYLAAVGMHSGFNALASVGSILLVLGVSNTIGTVGSDLALVAAVAFALLAFSYIRHLITESDFPALRGAARFQPKSSAKPTRPPAAARK
ncbi:MAG: PrsW family intramembrane metalloprotease [Thermoplasmata archaeon]